MMDCLKSNELMDAYLDDFLDEHEKQDFLEHIDNCPKCKQELEEMRLMLGLLHDAGKTEKEPPEELRNSVIRILNVQQAPTKIFSLWRPLAVIAAGIVIVFALYSSGILSKSLDFLSAKKDISNPVQLQQSVGNIAPSTSSISSQENGTNSAIQEEKSAQGAGAASPSSESIVNAEITPTAGKADTTADSTQNEPAVVASSTAKSTMLAPNAVAANANGPYQFVAVLDLTGKNISIYPADLPEPSLITTATNSKVYLLTKTQLDAIESKYNLEITTRTTGSNIDATQTYGSLEIIG